MSKLPIFTGSATAIVTPFKADGSLNLEKMAELIDLQAAGGTAATYAARNGAKVLLVDRAPEGENLTRNELLRMIRQIDKQRAQHHQMYSDMKWGAKEAYHLCVNTSGKEIKKLIPALAQYARAWFGEEE